MKARPIAEYHEDMGPVLWWKFPIEEPPYVGTPSDLGHTIEIVLQGGFMSNEGPREELSRHFVGGWPGYHTHFTPIEMPENP